MIGHSSVASEGRRETIDFWRGLVLCTIFVNHVPGNVFERLTFRNFGFSDSSEAFVFISGLSLALAYGPRLAAGALWAVTSSLARRAVRLYAVHLGLSMAGVAIFAIGAAVTADPDLMQVHGRDLVIDDPVAAVLGTVSLGHQFGYFNILPLYILLVGMAPGLLWMARRSARMMLAVSFGVYALSRLASFNVPSWPMQGTWFFDPFTWQFLMAVGMLAGLQLRTGIELSRWLLAGAAAVLVFAAFCATDGLWTCPGLATAMRAFADLDKTTLGLGRIAHFLSLACCLYASGLAGRMRSVIGYRPLCLIGRHGLAMFALLSLLAAVGQVVTHALGHSGLIDTLVIGGGLATLYGAALLLAGRSVGWHPAVRQAVPR